MTYDVWYRDRNGDHYTICDGDTPQQAAAQCGGYGRVVLSVAPHHCDDPNCDPCSALCGCPNPYMHRIGCGVPDLRSGDA